MNQEEVLEKTKKYVQQTLRGSSSDHDRWHIYRVWKTALLIAKEEGGNLFITQLAALLHDIADWKFHNLDETLGPKKAREWLLSLNVEEQVITHICEIITHLSFKGAGVQTPMRTIEGMMVQDADRLDALGAIGIARAFAYGGYKNREIYNPKIKPEMHKTREEHKKQYQKNTGTTINHFYEKLLLLKDRLNTPTARRIAEERHAFMEQYLAQFFKEWNEI